MIKKLAKIICETFINSPVFRVGGDEFVIVLKDVDYKNISALVAQFKRKIGILSGNTRLMPWERVSAAIGYALYDEKLDTVAKDVLTRADQEMYKCKKEMKQMR
jgi:diguanylate cyclase (GGDEF)-like protein